VLECIINEVLPEKVVIFMAHIASFELEYASLEIIVRQEVSPIVTIVNPEPRTCTV
jgi:hypothetical protein